MMTVKEASRLTGISIRTLQYYDKLGLLPAMRTESGYRLYDDAALERLQQILLFRELEFSLRDIRTILDNPNFDRRKALRQQIELLTLKKQHLEDLIRLARTLQACRQELTLCNRAGGGMIEIDQTYCRRRTHYAIQRI